MSAICGVFYKNGASATATLIEDMTASMFHLVLDTSNVWHSTYVALGQQITYTTAESIHKKSPFYSSTHQIAIAEDARIDNKIELCNQLKLHTAITTSELILYTYLHYGNDVAKHLMGDFAIAIWDRSRQTLLCISDIMNCRPIYYYNDEKLFAFASEIRALHMTPEIKREINLSKVAKFTNLNTIHCQDDTSTYFANIRYL